MGEAKRRKALGAAPRKIKNTTKKAKLFNDERQLQRMIDKKLAANRRAGMLR